MHAVARSCLLALALAVVAVSPCRADDFATRVKALEQSSYSKKARAVEALAASGDARAIEVLRALGEGLLFLRASDGLPVIVRETEGGLALKSASSGADLGPAPPGALQKIKVNNKVRRAIRAALARLTLQSADPKVRRDAADAVFKSADPAALKGLNAALAAETLADVKARQLQARAALVLGGAASVQDKRAAIAVLQARGDRDALSLLRAAAAGGGPVAEAAAAAAADIERKRQLWDALQNVIYGLSLGSVLLLAAIGLAITFGVMGVINMAHGEMVMIGAYVAFAVQQALRSAAPGLAEFSLLAAVPLAFLTAGAVGIAIERGVIRFLYGRPLETLLATWGVSLVLQQTVRSIFGPTNREVGTPSWISGALELGPLALTYKRLAIIVFALLVFTALLLVLRKTYFGLQMRAVTQNRAMAGAMGIRTGRLDALTFGLGSGIAGIAGVALSQIDNVSPNLGQAYIIDSFMVVVFGGVGNLWGTLLGALSLGVANKLLEPLSGAVLGKILVLVLIILFIQKRPRGLFALRGRALES